MAARSRRGGCGGLGANTFTTASVQDAGGIIDNGGYAITIAQVLATAAWPPPTAAWSSKAPAP